MDFFTRQETSRRTTRVLVVLFGTAFLTVAIATAIVLVIAYGMFADQSVYVTAGRGLPGAGSQRLELLLGIVAAIMAIMIIASLYRSATLSRGGSQVARMLGGTEVRGDDRDPLHRRLVNVVEEMAIASGLPVPEIYVLDQESGINAFAAGQSPEDAAIAVTRGSLERLDRAELQAVIAHEFSHILNGDMRLNLRLMGYGFGILVLSLLGRWLLRSSRLGYRMRNRGSSAAVVVGLALTVIGGIGVLLSRLIKAAVSRQREVLADASAVQFTREPQALAGALRKIGGYTTHLEAVQAEEVSHMLFGAGGRGFRGWFATHPPLDERIKALDPSFEPGDYISSSADQAGIDTDTGAAAFAGGAADARIDLDRAGTIETAAVGAALHAAIPDDLVDAAHSRESAWLLVLALAVAADPASREAQDRLLQSRLGEQRAARCRHLGAELAALDRALWLPLLELALPALKQRPDEQVEFLFELLERLADIDRQRSLFEYVLERMLRNHFHALGRLHAADGDAMSVARAVCVLIANVAAHGQDEREAARAAYEAGLASLTRQPPAGADEELARALSGAGFDMLDRALARLTQLTHKQRQQALKGVEVAMRHDARVTVAEAELFRAIAATLGCPIPPTAAIG